MDILDSGTQSAQDNMRCDQALLENLRPDGAPLLHVYSWSTPSLTHGYFLAPEAYLHLDKAVQYGLQWARRPTGGGCVFHLWDLAFSFLLPAQHPSFSLNPIENYRFVNEIVFQALSSFFALDSLLFHHTTPPLEHPHRNFCMALPTQYDVMYQGKKIAGAAQRKRRNGYLHQGTLSLAFPDRSLLQELLLSEKTAHEIFDTTFAPLGEACSPHRLEATRRELQHHLKKKFSSSLERL